MIEVFGFSFQTPVFLQSLNPSVVSFLITALVWLMIALAVYVLLTYLIRHLIRQLPGEIEDILFGIIRIPLILLIVAFGSLNSLELLPLKEQTVVLLERIFNSILVFITMYLLWRLIKDVMVYYGEDWARKTESRVDDVLIPMLNLFGPMVIIINTALIIFPLWGIDLSSVLLGAGVVGLVLGLALQETLSNIFSGMSLLIEAPFRTGDLIVLPDGRTCEVERLGMRSTQLYSLDNHSTIYIPNKLLSSTMIINITKPTVEQKASIEFCLDLKNDLTIMQEELKRIAQSHPNVLYDNLPNKICLIRERVQDIRDRANIIPGDQAVRTAMLAEAEQNELFIHKLELEGVVNQQLEIFELGLHNLIEGLRGREAGGFTEEEIDQIQTSYLDPVNEQIRKVTDAAQSWSTTPDPWGSLEEHMVECRLWESRNDRLKIKWKNLHQQITRPSERLEMRLDDMTRSLIEWLNQEYKILPQTWKNPSVIFKNFAGTSAQLQLWFYVDNIRLEHYNRVQRVVTDIARQVREQFSTSGIWI